MLFQQRDLIELHSPSLLPDGNEKFHPFLIISTIDVASQERSYLGVMMTSSSHTTKFSFPCPDSSFEGALKPNSHLQMHIVHMIRHENVKAWRNRMKKDDFEFFLEEFNSLILKVDK
ncbi:MAG: hypothetical protein J0L83_14630 [Chitinophagales bacterium]|nr:hypothetical protein [Chitinophagales bacterium]